MITCNTTCMYTIVSFPGHMSSLGMRLKILVLLTTDLMSIGSLLEWLPASLIWDVNVPTPPWRFSQTILTNNLCSAGWTQVSWPAANNQGWHIPAHVQSWAKSGSCYWWNSCIHYCVTLFQASTVHIYTTMQTAFLFIKKPSHMQKLIAILACCWL